MSDAFGDRQKGFERKYELDQEQQFRAQIRRDKLFGQWAAGQLGKIGADADKYAQEVVDSNFEKPGDDDMIGKVSKDLGGKVSDADLKKKLMELFGQAAQSVAGENK
jgi:hypothetical protein